jgi:hypothetical protein
MRDTRISGQKDAQSCRVPTLSEGLPKGPDVNAIPRFAGNFTPDEVQGQIAPNSSI